MNVHRRLAMSTAAFCLLLTIAPPPVDAGEHFAFHIGSNGLGISAGFGDWGVYTSAWSDPRLALNYNAALAGYGEWVWVDGLGRVWRPWVTGGWRPYTHGRWVFTSLGWTWVAYEPWGYIPHHYGHWANTHLGWVWAPGYTYHPARVVWVGAGIYVGWYATPPRGWRHTAHGYHQSSYHGYQKGYRHGYRDGRHDAQHATYVAWDRIGAENLSRHSVSHVVASRSRVETRNAPPSTEEVRRRGGVRVKEARLAQRTVSADGRRVALARPEGIAGSIERHSEETVRRALTSEALQRRHSRTTSRSAAGTAASKSQLARQSPRSPEAAIRPQKARPSASASQRGWETRIESRSTQRPRSRTSDSERQTATRSIRATQSRVATPTRRVQPSRPSTAGRARTVTTQSSERHGSKDKPRTAESPRHRIAQRPSVTESASSTNKSSPRDRPNVPRSGNRAQRRRQPK